MLWREIPRLFSPVEFPLWVTISLRESQNSYLEPRVGNGPGRGGYLQAQAAPSARWLINRKNESEPPAPFGP